MILTIDIGNRRTCFGLFSNERLVASFERVTDPKRSAEDLAEWLSRRLAEAGAEPAAILRTILSSVVPDAVPALASAIRRLTGQALILVDRGTIGLPIKNDNPASVGTERLIDALAASKRYGLPLIVINLGTATTISVLDAEGNFIGGSISPGLQTSADSLHRAAAPLPQIEIFAESADIPVVGPDSAGSIRSGVVQGTAAMLEGMISRIEDHLGRQAIRVVTGGFAPAILPHCRLAMNHEPHLLLCGLHDLASRGLKGE